MVLPVRLLRPRDLAHTTDVLRATCNLWERDWARPGALALSVRPAAGLALPGAWDAFATPGGAALWLQAGAGLVRALESCVFGVAPSAPRAASSQLAAELAAAAREALYAALADACGADPACRAAPAALPAALLRPHAGALLVTVEVDGEPLRMLVPGGLLPAAPHAAHRPAALVPLRAALSDEPVRLRAEVGSAELTLGHLGRLGVGDVITLDVRLDQALPLVGADSIALPFRGYLGRHDGLKALALTQH